MSTGWWRWWCWVYHHTGPCTSLYWPQLWLISARPPVQGPPLCRTPTRSNLFIIKLLQSASEWLASYWNAFLLLLINEVLGKVIFSQVCVIPSVHRGVASQHASQVTWPGGSASEGLPPGASASRQGSASRWECASRGTELPNHCRIQSTSRQCVAYWNTFMLRLQSMDKPMNGDNTDNDNKW